MKSATALVALLLCVPADAEPESELFRDPSRPFDERVADLVSRLSLEEKAAQMMMDSPAIPRLGIPAYHWWNEALHGVARAGEATVFPQAIALAATWDPDLHHRIASAIATEARAKYHEFARTQQGNTARYQGLTMWSPNINIFRDPRWGRGHETYGEDPFLTGRFAVAFISGLQGDDPKHLKTVATAKHFAIHSGPESSRHVFDAKVSARDKRETYFPAFETAIREGGAMSLMAAYNAVDGVPCSASAMLLDSVLRKEWGFQGAVVGDVDSVFDIHATHKFAKTAEESSALAVKAGNDLCSGETFKALPEAVRSGLVSEEDVDRSLARLLRLRFQLGMLDPPETVSHASIPYSENCKPEHDALALEAAEKSIVLLKNDGHLPWAPDSIKTLAVLGPTADSLPALLGNYHGTPKAPVTLLAGLKKQLEPRGVKILHHSAVPIATGFKDISEPFETSEIFTDASRKTSGLTMEVFDNTELEGTPIRSLTDTALDHHWSLSDPQAVFPRVQASVRWSGVLVAPKDGRYIIHAETFGGIRVLIDGKVKLDEFGKHQSKVFEIPVAMKAGKALPIRIEFSQRHPVFGKILIGWRHPDHQQRVENRLENALAAAREADHILLALGLSPDIEGEEMKIDIDGFTGGDRTSIQLPACQQELLEKVKLLDKPFTVVLTGGSTLAFDTTSPNAILHAWYYGQRGGDALASILLGERSPGGRLPITFYQSDADLPHFDDYAMNTTPGRTYRYFTGNPLYPFGHGLSYTAFRYGTPEVAPAQAKPDESLSVSLEITNTGRMTADEVVQIYAQRKQNAAGDPLRRLVGFHRITLAAGESRKITIPVPVQTLRHWDESKSSYAIAPGEWQLHAGASSADLRGYATVRVEP